MAHKLPRDTPRLFFLVEPPTFQHLHHFLSFVVLLTYAYGEGEGVLPMEFFGQRMGPFGLYLIILLPTFRFQRSLCLPSTISLVG